VRKKSVLAAFLMLLALIPTQAKADSNITLSFVLINPNTGTNAGAGNLVMLSPVNRDNQYRVNTDANGVATFQVKSEEYVVRSFCGPCFPNGGDIAGTQYLVIPKTDGSIQVISAADESMSKDSNGNWKISAVVNPPQTSDSPWQPFTKQINFPGNQHVQMMWMLTNGKVFMQTTNGQGVDRWWIYSPDANGNYANGTVSQAANPVDYNPVTFNGAVLHSGNVLIVGGEQNYSDSGVESDNTNKSELYNPTTNTWTEVAPPNNGQGDWANIGSPPFVELPDGRVMIGYFGNNGQSTHNESMIFDEKTMSWTSAGTNKMGRNTEAGFTLMQTDKVLTVNTSGNQGLTSAEVFDPTTGQWSAGGNTPASLEYSEIGPALSLPNGNVLATGATGQNAIFDSKANTWGKVPSFPALQNGLQLVAQDNEAAILPNGNVLTVTAGFPHDTQNVESMAPSRWVEYDWASNNWIWLPNDLFQAPSSEEPNGIFMLPLPTGQVMISNNGQMELFNGPGSPDQNWLPVVSSLSSTTLTPNTSYTVTGTQLSGLTQGQQWGDEWEAATNYPLVQVTNKATHHVFYGTATDISTTSIKPGTPSTVNFTLDSKVENGDSSLKVIASGFASTPVDVTVSGGVSIAKAVPTPTPTPSPTPSATSSALPMASPTSSESKSVAPIAKKSPAKATTCVKGKSTKVIPGAGAKCPAGFTSKKP